MNKTGFFVFTAFLFTLVSVNANPTIRFDYSTEEIQAVCKKAEEKAEQALRALEKLKKTSSFAQTAQTFDGIIGNLVEETSPAAFLSMVSTDPKVRDQSRDCETKTDQYMIDVYMRKPLYDVMMNYSKSEEYKTLNDLDRRLVDKILLAFKRSGMSLPEKKRKEVVELQKKLIDLQNQFSKAIADYVDFLAVTKDELKGLPQSYIDGLEKLTDGKYKVTLSYPHYIPFMENADNAEVRKKLYEKYSIRAGKENVVRLEQAIALRSKISSLLGYKNHAAYVLEERMAKRPESVFEFLENLKTRLQPMRAKELALMSVFKSKDFPKDTAIYGWDVPYNTNQIKKKNYQVDSEAIRQYFPLDHVTKTMFDIYQNMLGVTYVEVANPDVWHSSVKLFEVRNRGQKDVIAYFYMDLFPREGKYTHAAAASIRYGRKKDGASIIPISAIVANFSPKTKDHPSLLNHSEVETYFHEFGHIMHQVLTESKYDWFSGTKVARDFVEAPSQMLENWTWNPSMLAKISSHYETKKPLPETLVKKMLAAKNLNVGLLYSRQLVLGLFDMTIHTSNDAVDTTELWRKLQTEVMGIPLPAGAIPQAAVGHYMGGYDAAYYGYLWSEVFAADMFDRFEKNGLSDASVGADYRKWILSPGGSKDASELLKGFLGRNPTTDAFFESIGLQKQ